MKYLDKIPFRTAIIMTIFLGLSPFIPEPHLWQKLKMLVAGDLTQPLDMFDMRVPRGSGAGAFSQDLSA